jgi:ArpU family phage transcriptional regulator
MNEHGLPEIDWLLTKASVEAEFERYRIYKFLDFEEREPTLTAAYGPRYGSPGLTGDQTGEIAIGNVDEIERRRQFCERIERDVSRLDSKERELIEIRYMRDGYMIDRDASRMMQVGKNRFIEIRRRSFEKLARRWKIAVLKKTTEHNSDLGVIE